MNSSKPSNSTGILTWVRDSLRHRGIAGSVGYYSRELFDLLCDLTPARRKSRYGDIDFDFEHNVDTTWATVSLRTRLREWLSGGQYQPSEPALFRQMLDSLPISLDGFTFIDLGSGKGRTLLMASDYPFRRILGVELLAELNAIAQQNIARYHSDSQKCFAIEAHAADARRLEFPPGPILLYLFNPFPRHVWGDVLANLLGSLRAAPRPVYLIYHNPVHRDIVAAQGWLQELSRTQYFVIYEAVIREQGVRALATSSL
ncbi:MAG: class I SAM-dependent methyltransferase [Candidatus Korobacteraceae bacterium]|jgi:SAM-dependent methyltransferase